MPELVICMLDFHLMQYETAEIPYHTLKADIIRHY